MFPIFILPYAFTPAVSSTTVRTPLIAHMIKLVEKMIENGTAYESEGHVLFSVPSYPNYGALSGRDFYNYSKQRGYQIDINIY